MTIEKLRLWEKETGWDDNWAYIHRYHTDPSFREKELKYKKIYYYNNRENIKKKNNQHYYNNKEEILEKAKKYYENNREKKLEYMKEYFKRPEVKTYRKEYMKEYYQRKKNEKIT